MQRNPSLDLVDDVWWQLDALQDPELQDTMNGSFIRWKCLTKNELVKQQHHQWHDDPNFATVPILGNWTLKMLAGTVISGGLRYHGLVGGKAEWCAACFEAWMRTFHGENPQVCRQLFDVMAGIQTLQTDALYLEWFAQGGEWKNFEHFLEMRAWMVEKVRARRARDRPEAVVKEWQ